MDINYSMSIKEINKDFLIKAISEIANYDIFNSDDNFYNHEINAKGDKEIFISDTIKAINEFFTNTDHGFSHSMNVYKRSEEIVSLIQEEKMGFTIVKAEYLTILKWASIFHDLSRFYGVGNNKHEIVSKELVENVLYKTKGNDFFKYAIPVCIKNHDWFNLEISGVIDKMIKREPIADIFRLADKTSVSPEEELMRYYETGKRYHTPFFNPNLSIARRFDFQHNLKDRDIITHFLLIFILNENNFFFTTTCRIYKEWAKGKKYLKPYILDNLCRTEGLPTKDIEQIEKILRMVST